MILSVTGELARCAPHDAKGWKLLMRLLGGKEPYNHFTQLSDKVEQKQNIPGRKYISVLVCDAIVQLLYLLLS